MKIKGQNYYFNQWQNIWDVSEEFGETLFKLFPGATSVAISYEDDAITRYFKVKD